MAIIIANQISDGISCGDVMGLFELSLCFFFTVS